MGETLICPIDVILPIRPKSPRLEKVLQSLNSQSHEEWRLIALLDRDDGSNRLLVESVIGSRPKVFVECNLKRKSFPAVLNEGLSNASATFVARQDDDDVSVSSRFRDQLRLLQISHQTQIVTGAATVVDEEGKLIFRITQPEDPNEFCRLMLTQNVIPHSSVMFRRTAVVEAGGYDESMRGCEDYDLWLRMLTLHNVQSVNSEVVEILEHAGGMSRQRIPAGVIRRLNLRRLEACRRLGLPIYVGLIGSMVWSSKQLAPARIWRLVDQRKKRATR